MKILRELGIIESSGIWINSFEFLNGRKNTEGQIFILFKLVTVTFSSGWSILFPNYPYRKISFAAENFNRQIVIPITGVSRVIYGNCYLVVVVDNDFAYGRIHVKSLKLRNHISFYSPDAVLRCLYMRTLSL